MRPARSTSLTNARMATARPGKATGEVPPFGSKRISFHRKLRSLDGSELLSHCLQLIQVVCPSLHHLSPFW